MKKKEESTTQTVYEIDPYGWKSSSKIPQITLNEKQHKIRCFYFIGVNAQ